ncbi:MAG: response regulator [Anaerolineae bacterium]
MLESIRVLIVDDLPETRENVRKLLQFESDIEVIGQAGTGEEAIQMAQEHQPDIILMDINMPGLDGIGASQRISELVPTAQIVIMSVQSDSDYLRRAMLAGARDFLTKPFGGDELVTAIRRVHEKRPTIPTMPVGFQSTHPDLPGQQVTSLPKGNIITTFSPKGGSGCSTIALNLAVGLAKRGYYTILVDGSLQFGDVAVMLNMKTLTSIVDLSSHDSELDADLVSSVVQLHSSGLNVLLAPPRPEIADVVTDQSIARLLDTLKLTYDFIVVDTSSSLNDVTLTLLDAADRIVLVGQQTLPSLKNVSRFLNLTESLDYEPTKIWLVINRASNKLGISVKNISDTLRRPVVMTIPDDDVLVSTAINQGVPLVTGSNQKRAVSVALNRLADHVIQEFIDEESADERVTVDAKSGSLLGRLLGRPLSTGG